MSHASKMHEMQRRAEAAEKTIKWLHGLIAVLTAMILIASVKAGLR